MPARSVEPAGDFERNIETEARGRGVTVHRVKFSSPFENEGRRRLVRFLIAGDYDIVHVHNRPQDWQLVSLCRALGMRAVYTLHLPYERGRRLRVRASPAGARRPVGEPASSACRRPWRIT